ncbi:hypothetical protein ACWD2L_29980 [Streptomyces sp. NPDC002754]
MVINAQGNNEAQSTEPGTALLLAAAPAGKVGLIDAVSVLPTLAAVPPSVLTGTAAASVVELADPLDPQAVLTRLRTAAAQPGPLHLYVAGQLHLDHRQGLLHLALARTTPSTLRYTGLPWHWLTGELTLRRPHTTTVVLDLVADAEAWKQVGVGGLGLGHGTSVFGRVLPPPPRRTTLTPTYLRAYADIWRTGARPTPSDLHETAAAHAGPADALFVALGSGHVVAHPSSGGRPAHAPTTASAHATVAPVEPATELDPTETPAAAAPPSGTVPAPTSAAAPETVPIPASGPEPVRAPAPVAVPTQSPVAAPEPTSSAGPTSVPAGPAGSVVPPVSAVNGASGSSHDPAPAPGAAPDHGPMPDVTSASAPVEAPAERAVALLPSVPTSAVAAASGSLPAPDPAPNPTPAKDPAPGPAHSPAPVPGPAVELAKASAPPPAAAPGGTSPATATPAPTPPGPEIAPAPAAPPMPTVAPAAAAPAPTAPAAPDPHALLLAAVQAGRHGEAASIAAAWEGEALRVHGMRSSEVVHWMEVRADLARLAEEPGRSCELWIAVAHARIARGESPSDEDVEAAVDRAHHQFEQVRDLDRARGHATGLTALREQVPGRRPGALEAIRRRLDTLNDPTRKA